jgi:hypothetical protein
MTITVLQSIAFTGAWSGSFGSNVTSGSTVFLYGYQYSGTNAAMSSSNPGFNGSSVSGASELISGQNTGGAGVYAAIWMLPDLAGGAASVSLTPAGGTVDSNVGMVAVEVAGLGASPALDSGATPNPGTASGNSPSISSGSTGNITSAQEIIVGAGVQYAGALTLPGGAWSGLVIPSSDFSAAGWQVVSSSGGSYSYNPATSTTQYWFAGVAAIQGASTPGPTGPVYTAFMSSM